MSSCQNTPYLPASTPRSADVVLYLDLDGVVHHEKVLWHPRKGIYMSPYEAAGHALFEWVPILEAVLEPHPAVALVLSSTWCIRPGYSATLKRLPATLRARFIGGTYHKQVHGVDPWNLSMFRSMPRGLQVQDDPEQEFTGSIHPANGSHWMTTWRIGLNRRDRTWSLATDSPVCPAPRFNVS